MACSGNNSTLIGDLEESIMPLGGSQRRYSIITTVEHDRRYGYLWLRDQLAFDVVDRRIAER